ncbi:hypothetical protein K502DRAFT_349671 [Neoconidiobolus thromboides FSU 785]|nr:hypothetical protein K502DRAFT_349671 [Neoconidiobolus thromboides FSU 785]
MNEKENLFQTLVQRTEVYKKLASSKINQEWKLKLDAFLQQAELFKDNEFESKANALFNQLKLEEINNKQIKIIINLKKLIYKLQKSKLIDRGTITKDQDDNKTESYKIEPYSLYLKTGNVKLFSSINKIPISYELPNKVQKLSLLPSQNKKAAPLSKILTKNPGSLNFDINDLIEVKKVSAIMASPYNSIGPSYDSGNSYIDVNDTNLIASAPNDKKEEYDFLKLEGIDPDFLLNGIEQPIECNGAIKKQINDEENFNIDKLTQIINESSIDNIKQSVQSIIQGNETTSKKNKIRDEEGKDLISSLKRKLNEKEIEDNKLEPNAILVQTHKMLSKLKELQHIRLKYKIDQVSEEEYNLGIINNLKTKISQLVDKVPPKALVRPTAVQKMIQNFVSFDSNYQGTLKAYQPYTFLDHKKHLIKN